MPIRSFTALCAMSLSLLSTHVLANGVKPDPENATYLDGKFEVPLHSRSIFLYSPSTDAVDAGNLMLPARPVCKGSQPLASAQLQARQCPDGEAVRFEDVRSHAIVSEGRGLTEFSLYEIAGTPLFFTSDNGMDYAVAVIANFAGGSGVFYSLGLVPGTAQGRDGSSLLSLGDRVKAVQLNYDPKRGALKVTYLDPYADGGPNFDHPKRVHRQFRVQGRELVEIKAGAK